MRTKGSKNKIPSRLDLTKASIETVALSMKYFQKHLKEDNLTDEQHNELIILFQKMEQVLNAGQKHLSKDYL